MTVTINGHELVLVSFDEDVFEGNEIQGYEREDLEIRSLEFSQADNTTIPMDSTLLPYVGGVVRADIEIEDEGSTGEAVKEGLQVDSIVEDSTTLVEDSDDTIIIDLEPEATEIVAHDDDMTEALMTEALMVEDLTDTIVEEAELDDASSEDLSLDMLEELEDEGRLLKAQLEENTKNVGVFSYRP